LSTAPIVLSNAGPLIALGILVQAYRQNLLSFSQIELLINEIAARPDIWIGAKLCEQVLTSLRQPHA
jgi:hypothetical protein